MSVACEWNSWEVINYLLTFEGGRLLEGTFESGHERSETELKLLVVRIKNVYDVNLEKECPQVRVEKHENTIEASLLSQALATLSLQSKSVSFGKSACVVLGLLLCAPLALIFGYLLWPLLLVTFFWVGSKEYESSIKGISFLGEAMDDSKYEYDKKEVGIPVMLCLCGCTWLIFTPFIVAFVTVAEEPVFWSATGHMGGLFVAVWLVLCGIACIHIFRNGSSMTTTVHRTKQLNFLNPCKWRGKVFGNWASMFAMCLIFVQMLSFAAPPATYPESVKLKLEYLYSLSFFDFAELVPNDVDVFIVEQTLAHAVCALWGSVAICLVYCVNTKKLEYLNAIPMLFEVVNFLTNTCYVIVLSTLTRSADCVYHSEDGTPDPHLRAVKEMQCWVDEHRLIAAMGLLDLITYCVSVFLIGPFFMESFTGRNEIVFTRAYSLVDKLAKTIVVVVQVFASRDSQNGFYLYLGVAGVYALVDVCILLRYRETVCSFKGAALMKAAFSAYVGWGSACSLFAHIGYTNPREEFVPASLLAGGFGVLLVTVLALMCSYCCKGASETSEANQTHKQNTEKMQSDTAETGEEGGVEEIAMEVLS